MLTLLRYTLAAIFLAASVGCLGLWGWSTTHIVRVSGSTYFASDRCLSIEASQGLASIAWLKVAMTAWEDASPKSERYEIYYFYDVQSKGLFGIHDKVAMAHFPLWYPALVFALAAVGAMRLGKPFTIRSALIATTVVAMLLGIVAAL